MLRTNRPARWILLSAIVALPHTAAPAESEAPAPDPRAEQIAGDVMQAMGGSEVWSATRFVRWRFFGGRMHYWDRHSGDVRIESPARTDREGKEQPSFLVLMNVQTKQGRAWENGEQVRDAEALAEYLDRGHKIWVNDSYWMFMPYKLLDPGVRLTYSGERTLEDGRPADVLDLTFQDVGYTPENRYEVFVARDTGLIEQWSFFAEAAAEEPDFTLPWSDWKRFGGIMLATNHGQDRDWEIAVYDELPATVFQSSDPVE